MDCVSDQLATGRRIRILNVIDVSISGARVANEFDHLRKHRQLPEAIVCDNGREFRSKAMFLWSQRRSIKLQFIQPGKPSRNAFMESFNGKCREYCLDLHWFSSLADARETIERWQTHYNEFRPHRSLGHEPPAVFVQEAS